jgi:hypothetical protein
MTRLQKITLSQVKKEMDLPRVAMSARKAFPKALQPKKG